MKNNYLKNNNGISLIKAILLILVTILVVFLAYEVLHIVEFEVEEEDNPLEIFTDWTDELARI